MAWKDSEWKLVWDGNAVRPEGAISDEQLPCSAFQYKYVIHSDLFLESGFWTWLLASPIRTIKGTLTNHIGKLYKEKIEMQWDSVVMPLGFYAPIPTLGGALSSVPSLIFWTMQYRDDKEVRIFYKWMSLKNLPDEYKDKIQKQQTLKFEMIIGQDAYVVAGDKNKLYYQGFIATAGNQNVAKGLLAGEYIEVVSSPNSSLVGLKFQISDNDGYGNVICEKSGDYSIGDLPAGTKLVLSCEHGWVEIGKKEGNKITWYGEEKYSMTGDSYFNMTSAISGLYASGSVVVLDGEWGSNIINVSLPKGSIIWIDEHNIGIPYIGKRWAVYWFRSLKVANRIYAFHAKTCRSIFAVYEDGGKINLVRTFVIGNKEVYAVFPLLQGDLHSPVLIQYRDARWYLFCTDSSGNLKYLVLEPEFDNFSFEKWLAEEECRWYCLGHKVYFDLQNYKNPNNFDFTYAGVASYYDIFTDDKDTYCLTIMNEKENSIYEIFLGKEFFKAIVVEKGRQRETGVSCVFVSSNRFAYVYDEGKIEETPDRGKSWKMQKLHFESFSYIKGTRYVPQDKWMVFFGIKENVPGVYFMRIQDFFTSFVGDACEHVPAAVEGKDGSVYVFYFSSSGEVIVSKSRDLGKTWKNLEQIKRT